MSPDAFHRQVRAGRLAEILPEVVAYPGATRDVQFTRMAAQLWARGRGFLSHRAAGELWELDGVPRGVVELSLHSGKTARGVIVHRLQQNDRPAIEQLGPFIVSGIDRTLLDLAAVLPTRLAARALDDALRKNMTTLDRLAHQLVRDQHKKGCRQLRKLLAERDPRFEQVESRFETRMLRILREIDSSVVAQYPVAAAGRTYRIDFAYPAAKVGIECHSFRWHTSKDRWERDLERDRLLSLEGWLILYFSWRDLDGTAARFRSEVTRALRNSSAVAAENATMTEELG